ncbi:MAG TPA: hypothetical protein VIY09_06805 [Rhizomicrobium sp.]
MASDSTLVGPFWRWIADLNNHFGAIGSFIVAVRIACWANSVIVYRYYRLDEIELS